MVIENLAAPGDDLRKRLSSLFSGMMKSLFKEQGAQFRVELVADPAVQEFVNAHASALDSAFQKVEMSDAMRRRLTRSNYIFSGMKAFHELHEAFPSLIDENGNRKPFERFLNDVQSIDKTYNSNYLRAEYNFVAASAEMAGRWEQFMRDGDRYNLQYRTQRDDKVRPEHAALDRVTLPPSDSFWEEFYPPNGWNCRCTVVQVRKSKYPETPHDEAMRLGDEALQRDTKGIFRFNAGKEGKSVPDYNPYTIRRCSTCPIAKGGKGRKLAFVPDNEVCQACAIFHECAGNAEKSATAIERKHYLKEMEPLLARRCEKTVGDSASVTVGFSTYGNKHLFSDTFSRSRVLTKDDLKNLDELLANATYLDESGLTHTRTDGIEHFYYFQTTLRGREIRLNVAKKVETDPHGRTRTSYFLYSVNDI